MSNKITINLKKDEVILKVGLRATFEEVLEDLKEKMPGLKELYKEEKTPIVITGKHLKTEELLEIKKIIKSEIDVEIFDTYSSDIGIHKIRNTFEEDLEISETKYILGAVRSGIHIEYAKSIVILGDVNAGAEVIAGGNVVILGTLRGLVHAGASGNTKAIIAARRMEASQIRIANVLKEMPKEEIEENEENKELVKQTIAYLQGKEIVIEKETKNIV